MASYASSVTNARNDNIYLVRGGNDRTDQPAWYFIRVDNVKTRAFLSAIKAGAIDLNAFGEIIESGYGENPPQAILSHMKANYNFTAT